MVDKITGRLKQGFSVPAGLQEEAAIVRGERRNLPSDIDGRSRTFVTIRNTMIVVVTGMVAWIPVGMLKSTPQQFGEGLQSLLTLVGVMFAFAWVTIRRMRGHVAQILELMADRHPAHRTGILRLGGVGPMQMVFGPWFRRMYVPGVVERMWRRIRQWINDLILPG